MYGESINVKNSNLMYQYNQYTILNNSTLNIWLCVQVHQISDHTSSLTIVAVETKNISGDSGSNNYYYNFISDM